MKRAIALLHGLILGAALWGLVLPPALAASLTSDRVDGISASVAVKAPVRAATTANITLSGTQTIDGVAVVAEDRVLVKNQTTASANGIYVVKSSAWERAKDFDGNRDVVRGTLVMVTDGTTNSNTYWRVTASNPITIGTTSISFGAAAGSDIASLTFLQSGTGATAYPVQTRLRQTVSVDDFGCAGDGTTNDATCIANAITYAETSGAPKAVCFTPGKVYLTNSQLNVTTNGVMLQSCGVASGYSYEAPAAEQTATIKAGAAMTNLVNFIASEGVTYTRYGGVRGLILNGNSNAQRCINIAGMNVIEDVTVTGCTAAGIRLGDLTNQTHINRVSALSNTGGTGYGILATGTSTTTFSISNSNIRSNTIGMRLEAGVNVHVQNTVIESNAGVGLSLYKPDGGNLFNFLFNNVWFENNSVGTTGYNIHITSQTLGLTNGAQYIRFNNCNVNSSGANPGGARHIHIESARYVTFDRCSGLSGDLTNGVQLATNASYVEFIDWNGATITDNGNRNFTSGRETSGTKGWKLSGGITERGYTAAMGEWTTPTFAAGDYTSDSGSWTVAAGDRTTGAYALVGKTLTLAFTVVTSDVGSTPGYLKLTIPGGYTASKTMGFPIRVQDNSATYTAGFARVTAGETFVRFYTSVNNGGWATSAASSGVEGVITFEIQ